MTQLPLKILFLTAITAVFALPFLFPETKQSQPALSLILGLIIALTFGNPFSTWTKKATHPMLTWAVVGLGCGMNLEIVAQAGLHGIGYTLIGITLTLLLGACLGRLLGSSKDSSLLISVGTSICAGSAIAAIAPVIKAKHHDISISLATIFVLNAVALIIFPKLGLLFGLTDTQFGLWCGIAIHDTSSVVGASIQYGERALDIATTIKLARVLWIIPIALVIAFLHARKNKRAQDVAQKEKIRKPWFVLGFLLTAALVTWVPVLAQPGAVVRTAAEYLIVLTLFFIGSSLNRQALREMGLRPILQGLILWVLIASLTLGAILLNLVTLD